VAVEPEFPELRATTTAMDAAQRQMFSAPRFAPEPARPPAASAERGFASGLNGARTDEEAFAAKGAALPARDVVDEIAGQFKLNHILTSCFLLINFASLLIGFLNENVFAES
jgi:hypothetical protein